MMKKLLCIAALAGIASAGSVLAQTQEQAKGPEVLERDAQGHATKVKLGDYVMDVCTPEKTDGCVNPREIGLDQGNRPIGYWPGKPASQIDHPLPLEEPENKPE